MRVDLQLSELNAQPAVHSCPDLKARLRTACHFSNAELQLRTPLQFSFKSLKMEYAIAVLLNVLSSFIYSAILAWLEANNSTPKLLARPSGKTRQPPYQQYQNEENSLTPEQLRNRALFHKFSLLMVLNFVTFLSLYMAIIAPAEFRALSSKDPILWSQARVFGDYLPDIAIAKDNFQWVPFVIAMIAYPPIRFSANLIASIFRAPVQLFAPFTWRIKMAISMTIFICVSLVVGAISIYGYWQDKTFIQCLTIPALLAILAIGIGSSKR